MQSYIHGRRQENNFPALKREMSSQVILGEKMTVSVAFDTLTLEKQSETFHDTSVLKKIMPVIDL